MSKTNKPLYIGKPVAFSTMIKPIGSKCNLNCTYCYYLEKHKLYKDTKTQIIADNVLEEYIRQYIQMQDVPVIQFVWHGGEPTLLGVDYYRKALAIQEKHKGSKRIENVMQTNGTLLNDEWGRFFKEHNFLIGISIDGPRELHDKFRTHRSGAPSFDEVMHGIEILKKHRVEFNTMTVINHENSQYPLEIYHFLKNIGSRYIQFIPIVEQISESNNGDALKIVSPLFQGDATITDWSVKANDYGQFLIAIFDEWVRLDVGTYFIQPFDVALANWAGHQPGLCIHADVCGEAVAVEFNGDVYACDHFVFPEYLIGNLMQQPLGQLLKTPQQLKFGLDKKESLTQQCIDCDYRFACHGGCPKNRIILSETGEAGHNYFCEGYYSFFAHIHPYMQFMTEELKHQRAPANVMNWVKKSDLRKALRSPAQTIATPKTEHQAPTMINPIESLGRNSPCICGSGKKFKNCCMNRLK